MTSCSERLRQAALDLAWSLWGELGISSWVRRHANWAIDVEPQILFTAALGDADPRLRDESTDWCIRYGRYVSAARLRNLLRCEPPVVRAAFGEYAGTVAAHSKLSWPGAVHAREYHPTGRSQLDDFTRPALIGLRQRALFGVSARAEILRVFVAHPEARLTAADLAVEVNYTKRNVEKELESLRLAGLLSVIPARNQLRHHLAHPATLLAFVGERPTYFPPWSAIFRVLLEGMDLFARADSLEPRVRAVEARRTLRDLTPHLARAGLERPDRSATGPEVWSAFERWAVQVATSLADGDPRMLRSTSP